MHSVGEQTEAQNDLPKAMQLVGSTKWTKSLTSESMLFVPYHAITFCSPHFYDPPFHSKISDSCSIILLPSLAFCEAIPTLTRFPLTSLSTQQQQTDAATCNSQNCAPDFSQEDNMCIYPWKHGDKGHTNAKGLTLPMIKDVVEMYLAFT